MTPEQKLANILNESEVTPDLTEGKVTGLILEHDDGSTEIIHDAVLSTYGIDTENLGYLDAHPEGADRGGYVAYVFLTDTYKIGKHDVRRRVYYKDNDNEWYPG